MRSADEICMNVRRMRCRQVAVYLHWLYQHGITKQDYSLQLPEFKRTPAKLPQTWSKEEIEQILAAIDTENPTGKRNYAMFLLMARTGLRISDVVSLRFSNIDWKNSTISLSQQKTGNNLGLPLSKKKNWGWPLFHISKMDVPSHRRTSFSFVTLLHMTLWITTTTLIQSFGSICVEQELPCRKKGHAGVHTLRHSFATNLLKDEASLQDISQILGHSDINVTETYLRVDIDQLRLCAGFGGAVMKQFHFSSNLSTLMELYLTTRNEEGYLSDHYGYYLQELDCLSKAMQNESFVTRELVEAWDAAKPYLSNRTKIQRHNTIRKFAAFAFANDGISYVPDTSKLKGNSTFVPHIFTVDEISRILNAADNLPYRKNAPTRHLVIPAVIRLLYSCGLRVNEALRLELLMLIWNPV